MTPAQSRALERQRLKMDAAGERLVSVRLNEKTISRIDWLAKSYGSRQKVIEALLSTD